jgi:hypothetical protein
MTPIFGFGLAALLWVWAPEVALATPMAVPYSGLLTFENGTPYQGIVDLEVTLHSAASAGSVLWGPEVHAGVEVENGVLGIALGAAGAPLSAAVFSAQEVWLQLKIGGTTMQPRQQVLSVPYALRAGDAATVGGLSAASFAQASALAPVATAGTYASLSGKPVLAAVATSGQYSDLLGVPAIPPQHWQAGAGGTINTPSAAVGIGVPSPAAALDVAGAIRPGSASVCDAATEGSLRRGAGGLEICRSGAFVRLATVDELPATGGGSALLSEPSLLNAIDFDHVSGAAPLELGRPAGVTSGQALVQLPFNESAVNMGSYVNSVNVQGALTYQMGRLAQAARGFSASNYVWFTKIYNSTYTATGFSCTAWVRGTDTSASPGQYRVANNIFGDYTGEWWVGQGVSSGRAAVRVQNTELLSNKLVSDNQWHHLAFIWTFSGGIWSVMVYVDGALETQGALPAGGNPYYGVSAIGTTSTLQSQFYGYAIDDARIFGVALSPAQVQQLASAQAGPGYDAGSAGFLTANVGSPSQVAGQSGLGASGFSTTNYINLPRVQFSTFVDDGLTFSAWVRGTNTQASAGDYRVANTVFGDPTGSWWIGAGVTSGRASIRAGSTEILSQTTVADNQWHHVAFVYRHIAGVWYARVYVDGVHDGSAALPTAGNASYAVQSIGATSASASGQQFGYAIDGVRVYAQALTDAQVATLAE